MGIENIHVMRASLQKLLEGLEKEKRDFFSNWKKIALSYISYLDLSLSLSVVGTRGLSVTEFLVGLENSGWLRHIKAIVDAAIFLTKVR